MEHPKSFLNNDMATNYQNVWEHPITVEYHDDQWSLDKESTKSFAKFFGSEISKSRFCVDLGCGVGAATSYLANQFKETKFLGVDNSTKLIEKAKSVSLDRKISNIEFKTGDIFNLKMTKKTIDGVISLATLSWLSEIKTPMIQIFTKLKPKWIGISSLFYDGEISCTTEVIENISGRKFYYNTYSVQELDRLSKLYGYKVAEYNQFDIGIDLPRPKNLNFMSTYTQKLSGAKMNRIQISGPLMLNWYFIKLKKFKSNLNATHKFYSQKKNT